MKAWEATNICEKRCEHAWSKITATRACSHTNCLSSFFFLWPGWEKSLCCARPQEKERKTVWLFLSSFLFPLSAPISSFYFMFFVMEPIRKRKEGKGKVESLHGRSVTTWPAFCRYAHMLWFLRNLLFSSLISFFLYEASKCSRNWPQKKRREENAAVNYGLTTHRILFFSVPVCAWWVHKTAANKFLVWRELAAEPRSGRYAQSAAGRQTFPFFSFSGFLDHQDDAAKRCVTRSPGPEKGKRKLGTYSRMWGRTHSAA